MFNGEFDPSEMIARVPPTAPATVGAKVAVNDTLPPAVTVAGKVSPVIERPLPLRFACEIVTVDPPVFVSVSPKLALLPTCTLPNARMAGPGESVPAATPAPARLTTTVSASDLKVMLPLKLPPP